MKYSKKKHKEVIENYKKTFSNMSKASELSGIDRGTFEEWIEKYPEFKKDKESVDDRSIDFVESKLMKLINEDKEKSIHYFLDRKGKKRGWTVQQENYKELYYNLFMMFMSYVSTYNNQLSNQLTFMTDQFIDLIQNSNSPEHLEFLIKEKNINQITNGEENKS
jgi:hypothetical protein